MSEYQYYEFLAIDRPLDETQVAEVRSLSTRAKITATSFVNEYQWGDFRGDPGRMMERYYDAHLYFANWGTHRVMLRVPRTVLDPEVVEDYCIEDAVSAKVTGEFVLLDFITEDEPGWSDVDDNVESLAGIVGVRAELATGDLRPLYLSWLAFFGPVDGALERAEDFDVDDHLEPPVPPGLAMLTAPQQSLADFLRVDQDLLAVAGQSSAELDSATPNAGILTAWLGALPAEEKNDLLVRVIEGDAARVRAELSRRFRAEGAPFGPTVPRRTVAELLDGAAR